MRVAIANLPGSYLGQTHGTTVYLDVNAAGRGWFIDSTPRKDSEFAKTGNQGEQGRMDLLTVVMHELGHVVGYGNGGSGVMSETLSAGTRLVSDLSIVATGTLIPQDDLSIDTTTATPRTPTSSQPAGAIDGLRLSVPFVAPELNRPLTVLWNTGRLSRGGSTMIVDPLADLQRSWDVERATRIAAGSLALYGESAVDLTSWQANLEGMAEPQQIGSEIGMK
jgi:hypothetical protein